MDVQEYLAAAGLIKWRYGEADCTLFAADWAIAKCGVDPAAGIRGTYWDEGGAARIVAAAGGMSAFIAARLTAIGWKQVQGPNDGDIGVVRTPLSPVGRIGLVPAIRAGGLWVVRTRYGQRAAMFECKAIWRG